MKYRSTTADRKAHGKLITNAQRDTFQYSYGREPSPEEATALNDRIGSAFDASADYIFVFCCEEQLLGYYWFVIRSPGIAYILDLFILDHSRGKGYGSKMWDAILAKVRSLGVKKVMLTVSDANQSAFAFYLAKGLAINERKMRGDIAWYEMSMDLDVP